MLFFINLYENLTTKSKSLIISDKNIINKRKINIIISMCMLILINFPFNEEDFYNSSIKNKKGIKFYLKQIEKNKDENDIISIALESNDKIDKNDKNEKYDKYLEYDSYESLFQKFYNYQDFDDSIFKSFLLIQLENINEVSITQETKFKFISDKKSNYDKEEYKSFLKLSFYNKEIRDMIFQIIELFNIKKDLGYNSYKTFLLFIQNIINNQKVDKCTFNHFMSSRKLCCTFFINLFSKFNTENNKNKEEIIAIFLTICNSCFIYHSDPFFYDLIYELINKNETKKVGGILLQSILKILLIKSEKVKKFYLNKINLVNLIYKIVKENKIDEKKNEFFGLKENEYSQLFRLLFDDDLLRTRCNCYKNNNKKKKPFIELMLIILTKLSIQTNNPSFIVILFEIIITNIKNYKVKFEHTQSVVFYFDKQYYKGELKNNIVFQFFLKHESCDIPSFCVYLIYKTIKAYLKAEDDLIKPMLDSLINSFIQDSKLIYGQIKECTKKSKNNTIYNLIRDKISQIYKEKKNYMEDFVNIVKNNISNISKNKNVNESNIKDDVNTNYNRISNFFHSNSLKEMNNSFESCSSSKSQKQKCQINKKKKVNLGKLKKNENQNLNNNEEINTNIPIIKKYSQNNLTEFRNQKVLFTTQSLCENIESYSQFILFPKLTLLQQIFGIYFIDRLFYDETFVKMKKYFNYFFTKVNNNGIKQNPNIDNFLNYPTMIRNYTPSNFFYKDIFLRNDFDFFSHEYFKIIHPYFLPYLKKIKKRIFKKKCENKEIINYLLDRTDKTNKQFYCDLITNSNVIFGEIIINKNIIYFHNKNKQNFIESLTDEEKENYLLCALEYDYYPAEKQIFIIRKEIHEIINRRYLFLFQACEIFLKNGKSYFFNFFSENNKIEFFKLFDDTIKIIDLKEDFRKKDYTQNWLKNKISTLSYLLQINKYSSRSYNDTNQYPIIPLLKLRKKKRDLKYTIQAQTEEQRELLATQFDVSMGKYHSHYNIHYSNSSFVLYYLIRMNPFTYNQVNLQGNKLDVPNRQFHTLEELLIVYERSKETRELIPEFFLSTELFYNYNCNFFGFRQNDQLMIHNLGLFDNLSPLEYVCNNLEMINSKEVKSEINFFIDNIFGVGQIGTRNDYNTFGKYCYQEFINLKSKLESYISKELSFEEIKEKITRKINKIISLGQTPFKLIEEKHVQYEEINDSKNSQNEHLISNLNLKIISMVKFVENKMIYVLSYKDGYNYEFKILTPLLKPKFTIPIPNKIKLLTKLKLLNSDFLYGYKFNSKFVFLAFNFTIILCRFADNSFIFLALIGNKTEYRVFITESFITTIIKSSINSFITGHANGKIMEWNFTGRSINNPNFLSEEVIELKRTLIAHKDKINGIYLINNLGVIITTCIDYTIYIRKYYDFTLLSIIEVSNKVCIQLVNYYAFIYILFYNVDTDDYVINLFSMNGILLQKGENSYINNIEIDVEGHLLVGYYEKLKIDIYDTAYKNVIKVINLESLLINEIEENLKFMNFIYDEVHNCIYCNFSNGVLLKKYLNENKEENENNNNKNNQN